MPWWGWLLISLGGAWGSSMTVLLAYFMWQIAKGFNW